MFMDTCCDDGVRMEQAMPDTRTHLGNVADNLQLLADLGCSVTSLLTPCPEGLQVRSTARPATVAILAPPRRIGDIADGDGDREAYECFATGHSVVGARVRTEGGMRYVSHAYPLGEGSPNAVIVRDVPVGLSRAFGPMEEAFTEMGLSLLKVLHRDALRDGETGEVFSTARVAGDGVVRLDKDGGILYASPNLSNILRMVGFDSGFPGGSASHLPGYQCLIEPALLGKGCFARDVDVSGHTLYYRSIPLMPGALLLVEDVTELRAHEREMRVKEATIREVHHRVKNNLQTIESLLRIQMRRTESVAVRSALSEAVTRVGSMAVAHDMLSCSREESVDVARMVSAVAEQVRRGLVGSSADIRIHVTGQAGEMDARGATSLALAVAETVHNAIEHGLEDRSNGAVLISLERQGGFLRVVIEDDGRGLPDGFSLSKANSMGLVIARTMVEEDLSGSLHCGPVLKGTGARFEMSIPVPSDSEWKPSYGKVGASS